MLRFATKGSLLENQGVLSTSGTPGFINFCIAYSCVGQYGLRERRNNLAYQQIPRIKGRISYAMIYALGFVYAFTVFTCWWFCVSRYILEVRGF